MSSKDIERSHYLRKLYEKQMDKVDPELDYSDRVKAAMEAMDKKLGKEWREEIKIDGDKKLDAEAAQPFYMRVMMVGDEEGLGYKGSEAPEEDERPNSKSLKEQVMCRVKKLLDEML